MEKKRVLIINPNSTKSMTDGIETLVNQHFADSSLNFTYFTAPDGPSSINNDEDCHESAKHCIAALQPAFLEGFEGFVVACYSDHPLVAMLKESKSVHAPAAQILGIFPASIDRAEHDSSKIPVKDSKARYGIVSTGKVWEKLLTAGVERERPWHVQEKRFAGVETTGLNATELHDAPWELVRRRLKEATQRLLEKGKVRAICLGCAGMAGMDETVREACVEALGKEEGESVKIVDGIVAAVEEILEKMR